METRTSVSPDGTVYALPKEEDYQAELARIEQLVDKAREKGQEIVVVMGVGFVGAVMAAIVADTTDGKGTPSKFVIGMQRPSARSYWKIPMLNQGISPVKAEDPEVDPMISRCVIEKKTLVATFVYDVLRFADVVIVDVQLDYAKNELGNVRNGHVEMSALEESFDIIAHHIKPDCLVLIETTVAPGTTEQVALPAMRKVFRRAGDHERAPPRPQLRTCHAGARLRCLNPGFLARLLRCERGGKRQGSQVLE